ncbi:MAG TPA: hypothetical protein VNM90_13915, partial [Haliangium sp.]|nr:hypothetical protein [Haliangium sp.]
MKPQEAARRRASCAENARDASSWPILVYPCLQNHVTQWVHGWGARCGKEAFVARIASFVDLSEMDRAAWLDLVER